jgi:hypothetical protein
VKSRRCLKIRFLAALALALLLAACAPVQPWERGRLAQPHMALEPDGLLAAMDEHVYSSKEAASGGPGAAGGGCGCN